MWLPKFVDDLIRGIVRYKIKIFKDAPKKLAKATSKDAPANVDTKADPTTAADPASNQDENASPTKKSLLKRAKTEKLDRKLAKEAKAPSSRSLG